LGPGFNFESVLDSDGNTFMTLAAKTGMWEVMDILIRKGASTDSQDGDGNTPLHISFM